MENYEFEKAEAFRNVEIIEYIPNSVVVKTIIKKTSDNIRLVPFNPGEASAEKVIPYDTLVHITQGKAEVVLNGIPNLLDTGQSIVIPANTLNIIRSNERFKIISTIINTDI